jgi:transposase InsO family protein
MQFGVPATVTSSCGTLFSSKLKMVLFCHLGIQHITSTTYQLQVNGMIERAHRQLKDSLRARLAGT